MWEEFLQARELMNRRSTVYMTLESIANIDRRHEITFNAPLLDIRNLGISENVIMYFYINKEVGFMGVPMSSQF